jgi:hypothetical protein
MKTFEEDKELGRFLKSVKLESPGVNFSSQVMNRIFAEVPLLEQVKKEPIFGKGFWIILSLFGLLFVAMIILSGSNLALSEAPSILPQMNTEGVMTGYRSFLEKLGNLPAGISGIFLASSLLVLIEKLLESKKPAIF